MSEFRVVKCKNCNASLTELKDEKLSSCIQCGYNFTITSDISNEMAKSTKTKLAPEIMGVISQLKKLSKIKSTTTIHTKKKSSWRDVIKWYLIITFSLGFLSRFF